MFFTSALQRAIKCGLADGGDLSEELRQLKNYPIRSKQDAQAICNALDKLMGKKPRNEELFWSSIQALVGLFQEVDDRSSGALPILFGQGLPRLCMLVEREMESVQEEVADTLLFALKILAMYRTHEGSESVVRAAQMPLKPDAYMWSVIFSQFDDDHPERDFVFDRLSEALPPGLLRWRYWTQLMLRPSREILIIILLIPTVASKYCENLSRIETLIESVMR